MVRVICPFCLKTHDFEASLACPEKPYSVPRPYVRDYDKIRPLWLLTVGFPQHGKTTYLAALTLMLRNLADVWPGVFYRALDNHTTEEIRKIYRDATEGKPSGKTPLPDERQDLPPRPLLFNVHNLPEAGSRCLIMYDVAGQVYNNQEVVQNYVAALRQVTTIWFLVSLTDLEDKQNDKSIVELFNAYLSGMEGLNTGLQERNLIVVYTKADEVQFPPAIFNYIGSDPLQWLTVRDSDTPQIPEVSFPEYVAQMRSVSDKLREYTQRRVKEGSAFITMVEEMGMNLVFCGVSALGQSPDNKSGRLQENATRNRVLDPFLWAVALDMPTTSRTISLILDASPTSQPVYEGTLVATMTDILDNHGEVTTYYLGQQMAASIPGQLPPSSAPITGRTRLIGPILQTTSPLTRLLVVVAGPILDLEDFYDSPWRNRLMIVSMGEENLSSWPHQFIYRPGMDVRIFTTRLLSLFEEKI